VWGLEEVQQKYDHVPVGFTGDTRKPDFLKINPNGHVPTLDDDGFIIWESMAINLYLAEKYGKAPLWPSSAQDHGAAYQWSFWGMTELEPHLISIFLNRVMAPPEKRNEQAAQAAVEALKAPLKVLNDHLNNREYLLGKDFTIADLNVAAVMMLAPMVGIDFSQVPTANKWLQKCLDRKASQKARSAK
jgi:glutathione S-transferase